jgi:UDPglucose 6-dehydrogenase
MRTTDRIQVMSVRSAELTKYAANAMLATRISFMNELAALCEVVGADIESIRKGIGSDPRIGPKFLFAGAGYGGSCFGKDLRALAHLGREIDVPLQVVNAVDRANERQKRLLGERVIKHFGGRIEGKRIGIWGLSFKPETDDIREAPSLTLIDQLLAAGAHVIAYDPVAGPNVKATLGDRIELAANPYAAAEKVDALVLVTEWHELRQPDFDRLAATMRTKVLVDGRNVWPRENARAAGFTYYGIGRP